MKGLFQTLLFCFLSVQVLAQTEVGMASVYHDKYHGGKTASGEIYDKDKFTAAHRTLPFGTVLKVTRTDTGKSIKVKVNDRGPFVKGRVVDLSRAAATHLNMVDAGVVKVKVSISSGETSTSTSKKLTTKETEPGKRTETPTTPGKKTVSAASKAPPKEKVVVEKKIAAESIDISVIESGVKGDFATFDLYKVQVLRMRSTGYGVQVASYSQYENVLKQIAMLQENWFKNVMISVQQGADGTPVYKVILGPFPDRATATSYKNSIKGKGMDGFILDLKSIPIER